MLVLPNVLPTGSFLKHRPRAQANTTAAHRPPAGAAVGETSRAERISTVAAYAARRSEIDPMMLRYAR